jgi:hypothetical protein
MATLSPVNGIFMRESKYDIGYHLDKAHLLAMDPDANKPTDLGVVDMWAFMQKREMPLYKMANFGGKGTEMLNSHQFKFTVPISTDDTVEIVADITTTDKPGIDNQKFEILVNEEKFGHGSILKFDKYSRTELVVTHDPIRRRGEAVVYTVMMVNNNSAKFLDKKYLTPGMRLQKVSSVRSPEYGQAWDHSKFSGVGAREYLNYVGMAEAQKHYHLSKEASIMEVNNKIIEFVQIDGIPQDMGIPSLERYMQVAGLSLSDLAAKKANGQARTHWATVMDVKCIQAIAQDIENYLMWGSGGRVKLDGQDEVFLPVGLWHQIDAGGYKHIYTKDSFGLSMFKNVIQNFYEGKQDYKGPDPSRILYVQTGLAGMYMANEMIRKEASAHGLVYNGTDTGMLKGDRLNLSFGLFYTEIVIPFIATLRFVYNPALDNTVVNSIENPKIDGFNLSSYSYIIFDIDENGGSDNIKLLKYGPDHDLHWKFENGTWYHPATPRVARGGWASNGDFTGYKAKFWQRYPAIWVKDPTRVLKIVMKNPITGNTL